MRRPPAGRRAGGRAGRQAGRQEGGRAPHRGQLLGQLDVHQRVGGPEARGEHLQGGRRQQRAALCQAAGRAERSGVPSPLAPSSAAASRPRCPAARATSPGGHRTCTLTSRPGGRRAVCCCARWNVSSRSRLTCGAAAGKDERWPGGLASARRLPARGAGRPMSRSTCASAPISYASSRTPAPTHAAPLSTPPSPPPAAPPCR
jgi:hypothetical protein